MVLLRSTPAVVRGLVPPLAGPAHHPLFECLARDTERSRHEIERRKLASRSTDQRFLAGRGK
jgi:hypothetical protein